MSCQVDALRSRNRFVTTARDYDFAPTWLGLIPKQAISGNRQNKRLTELTGYQAPRQMLHARKLAFKHPRSGKKLSFEAPWPDWPRCGFQPPAERKRMNVGCAGVFWLASVTDRAFSCYVPGSGLAFRA